MKHHISSFHLSLLTWFLHHPTIDLQKIFEMKTVINRCVAMAAKMATIKKEVDLLIVRLTNLKTYATVEAIVIGLAN